MSIKFTAITKQSIFWNLITFHEALWGFLLFYFLFFYLDLLAFDTLMKFSPHSQQWIMPASLWVQFEIFPLCLPVSSRAQTAWWEALVYCGFLFCFVFKCSLLCFSTSKNLKDSENYYCFSTPLQFFCHYLRQWLKNAIRLHIFNEGESNILRFHNQCRANQENICGLRVCVY